MIINVVAKALSQDGEALRILLRAYKNSLRVTSLCYSLNRNLMGGNVGNLLFSQTMCHLLSTKNSRIRTNTLICLDPDRVNATHSQVVVPLANAFWHAFIDDSWTLTELFNKVPIPVIVMGAGTQDPVSGLASVGVLGELRRAP